MPQHAMYCKRVQQGEKTFSMLKGENVFMIFLLLYV